MHPWPETRDTLLTRLTDPADQRAWQEFAELYEPLVFRFALARGLQDADARDITQRVLWTVARAAEDWQPGKQRGRFRGWLARVTTNAVINLVQRDRRHQGSGRTSIDALLEQTPQACEGEAQAWQHQRRLELFRFAARRVRPKVTPDVWDAFWRTSVVGEPMEVVAKDLNKSLGALYAARSRVLAKIRQTVAQVEDSESIDPDRKDAT